jgi:phosphoglycerate kinase
VTVPKFKTLDDLPADLTGEVALVRVDLNLPMKDGSATDVTRAEAVKPTILELAGRGAKVLLLAHFGRPGGQRSSMLSTSMVIGDVEKVVGKEIMFIPELTGPVVAQSIGILGAGDIGLLDNSRFWPGEEGNDPDFAQAIAANGTLYVNDAFSAAHRAHATTEGLAHFLPAYAGRAMEAELKALEAALGSPEQPVAAVVGGAKVSTKLAVLEHLVGTVEQAPGLGADSLEISLVLGGQSRQAHAASAKRRKTLRQGVGTLAHFGKGSVLSVHGLQRGAGQPLGGR